MKKTLFLTIFGFIIVELFTVPVAATDSAASFEALQRQEKVPQKAPPKKAKKTKRKPPKAVPTETVSKLPEQEEQICFEDANGETWCYMPDSDPSKPVAGTTNSAPISSNNGDQANSETNEPNAESLVPTEPIPVKTPSSNEADAERKAQEAADQSEFARVTAHDAANKAQDAAAQAKGQSVTAIDFTGYGEQTWPEGTRHAGQWQNGKPTGYGIRIWLDGKRYEGEWLEDKRNGYGIQTWRTGERYEGQWVAGKKSGHGAYYWEDGQHYQGEFDNGVVSGHGILTWPDGQRYQGQFSDDSFNGRGTLFSPKGAVLQKGIWRNGEPIK